MGGVLLPVWNGAYPFSYRSGGVKPEVLTGRDTLLLEPYQIRESWNLAQEKSRRRTDEFHPAQRAWTHQPRATPWELGHPNILAPCKGNTPMPECASKGPNNGGAFASSWPSEALSGQRMFESVKFPGRGPGLMSSCAFGAMALPSGSWEATFCTAGKAAWQGCLRYTVALATRANLRLTCRVLFDLIPPFL